MTQGSGDSRVNTFEYQRLDKEFTQPVEFLQILSQDKPLATLHELQHVYTVPEVYDLLEIQEAKLFFQDEANKREENK